jgi:hypothetical protein
MKLIAFVFKKAKESLFLKADEFFSFQNQAGNKFF